SASSSTNAPRDTLITTAPGGSAFSTGRSMSVAVAAVRGVAITRTSLSAASRGRSRDGPTHRIPAGPPRSARRRTPAADMPGDGGGRGSASVTIRERGGVHFHHRPRVAQRVPNRGDDFRPDAPHWALRPHVYHQPPGHSPLETVRTPGWCNRPIITWSCSRLGP